MKKEDDDSKDPRLVRFWRTPGWTKNRFDAERIVLDNIGDIHEGRYQYAVIEELPEGLYPFSINEWWYYWNTKKDRYVLINKPEEMKMFKNFSIG
jgi:uncharacterized protein involved in copper resistance